MKHLYYLLATTAMSSGLLFAGYHPNTTTTHEDQGATSSSFHIVIDSTPPSDLAPGSDSVKLAEFAWAEFFALNWQSSYATDHKRDHPDQSWNYTKSDKTSLAVWETYAHRAELRPYDDKMLPFDDAPHYSYGFPLTPEGGASLKLFDNLDENSEIGSCVVYKLHQPKDTVRGGDNMVLYQAKVNRAEYEYISTHYPTKAQLDSATTRTANNISNYGAYYKPDTLYKGTCQCPPGVVCLPCGDAKRREQGTIEVKTAWRRLAPDEDTSRYLTRRVIYYKEKIVTRKKVVKLKCYLTKVTKDTTVLTTDTTQVYYSNATYALIGLHIIHKTANYPDFVFATFEHVDVERQHMALQLLNTNGYLTGKLQPDYPRLHGITGVANQATAAAHAALAKLRPNSVLQYYRLTGVQGTPTNNPGTFNFYLANYVVESDKTLADFHGSGFAHPFNNGCNTLLNGKTLSAGGCQGCHGVAQTTLGTDFSFLLDNVGKPVKYPDPASAQYGPPAPTPQQLLTALRFNKPPAAPLGKLGRYVKGTQAR